MSEVDRALRELARAYEGLEDPRSFADGAAVESYRAALLERTAPQADFLLSHLPARARVLEVGSGNGRLLVELAQRRALEYGLGLDVAGSRIAFASEWAAEEGRGEIEFVASDALAYPLEPESFSTAICITGAFAYFEPIASGTAERLAQKLHAALEPGGLLCLELYPHPEHRRLLEATGGEARIWKELPSEDPWRFYLSFLAVDQSGEVLTHEKTFIHRDSGEVDSGRRERVYLYTEESLGDLLAGVGFRDLCFYEGWRPERYEGGELMVVTAAK